MPPRAGPSGQARWPPVVAGAGPGEVRRPRGWSFARLASSSGEPVRSCCASPMSDRPQASTPPRIAPWGTDPPRLRWPHRLVDHRLQARLRHQRARQQQPPQTATSDESSKRTSSPSISPDMVLTGNAPGGRCNRVGWRYPAARPNPITHDPLVPLGGQVVHVGGGPLARLGRITRRHCRRPEPWPRDCSTTRPYCRHYRRGLAGRSLLSRGGAASSASAATCAASSPGPRPGLLG